MTLKKLVRTGLMATCLSSCGYFYPKVEESQYMTPVSHIVISKGKEYLLEVKRTGEFDARLLLWDDKNEIALDFDLKEVIKNRGGLTSPLLLGSDLDSGITFFGRDANGRLWSNGYIVKKEGNTLNLKYVHLNELLECDIVRRYIGVSEEEYMSIPEPR